MNNTQMGDALRQNADPLTGGGAYQPASSTTSFSNGMGAFGEVPLPRRHRGYLVCRRSIDHNNVEVLPHEELCTLQRAEIGRANWKQAQRVQ